MNDINTPPEGWQEEIQWKALTWYLTFREWAPSYRKKIEALIRCIKIPYFLRDSMDTLSLEQLKILHTSYDWYNEAPDTRTEDEIHGLCYTLIGKISALEDEIMGRVLRKFIRRRKYKWVTELQDKWIEDLIKYGKDAW